MLTQGVFRTIAYPGAAITIAACANNNGEVVGGYLDSNGVSHGFLELPGERIPLADAELGVLPLTKEIRIAIADAETPNNGFAWLGLIS